MKHIILLSLVTWSMMSCSEGRKPEAVVLTNPLDLEQPDAPVVIKRNQLETKDESWQPVLKDKDGNLIASQTDDLDGDNRWDELSFVYSLSSKEKAILTIDWIKVSEAPVYKRRTNIRCGYLTSPAKVTELQRNSHGKNLLHEGPYPYQMDGIAWENDKMGFRHYFDGRNCRDVFGKRVTDMVLDTVGIKPDGNPGDTYHVLADWGRDILSVVTSFGPGGLAMQKGDSLIRLGVVAGQPVDNVDSTCFRIVTEGPVRSIFNLDFIGWDVYGEKVDIHETVTIWAGSYGYENKITTSPLPAGCSLVSGIVRNNNDKELLEKNCENKVREMITHDRQTYNKEYYMGMAMLIPDEEVVRLFDIPGKGKGIDYTWCVELKPGSQRNYNYNVYAAWELQDEKFKDREFFVNLIDREARRMVSPVMVSLK